MKTFQEWWDEYCGGKGDQFKRDMEIARAAWFVAASSYNQTSPGESDQRDAAVLRMIEAIAPKTVENWRAMLPTYEGSQAAMSVSGETPFEELALDYERKRYIFEAMGCRNTYGLTVGQREQLSKEYIVAEAEMAEAYRRIRAPIAARREA